LILVMGGLTGGIGQPLHQQLCGIYSTEQVVMSIGRKHCDVESEESIERFAVGVTTGMVFQGPLHVINATGISVSAMIHKASLIDLNRMLRVNLVANILLLKHFREIFKNRRGTFTMLSSIAATDGPVGTAGYASSKAALGGLVKVAAREFARLNTRVNLVELGYTNMGMISQVQDVDAIQSRIPLYRLGCATDVAQACKFLIDCDWITGASVKLNGGMA
jgi:NAD(P)-dependent dehydrogenase (short-subunit alcohol dehydrogenase family)